MNNKTVLVFGTIVLGHDQTDLEESIREWLISQNIYLPLLRIKKM